MATDTVSGVESTAAAHFRLPGWQLVVLLVGFPLLYWLNSLSPWSYRLFVSRDHRYYIPFGISICVLHWASVATALAFLRRAGHAPAAIGLRMGPLGLAVLATVTVTIGGLLIAMRMNWPANTEPPADWRFYYPFTFAERCLFVFMAFSAGYCEEIVYRGFAIHALQGRGWRAWQAVLLATLSFILIHGVAGIFLSPFLFVVGLFYGALFLWRSDLTICIYLHVLFDLMAVAAI